MDHKNQTLLEILFGDTANPIKIFRKNYIIFRVTEKCSD
jgi:hypothetical protein